MLLFVLILEHQLAHFRGELEKLFCPSRYHFPKELRTKCTVLVFNAIWAWVYFIVECLCFFFCFLCCYSETLFLDSFAAKNVCDVWHVETSMKCLLLAIELSFHNKVTLIHPLIRLRNKKSSYNFFRVPSVIQVSIEVLHIKRSESILL